MSLKNIPSEDDFARARAAMRERDRGLSDVSSRVLECFRSAGLHEAFVFYSPTKNLFVAHLFYDLNTQLAEATASGLSEQIEGKVVEELAKAGRGSHDAIKVCFEWDSDENVKTNFGGDYYLRLR